MKDHGETGRTDTVARLVHADIRSLYEALTDPALLVRWLPPKSAVGRIDAFESWPGGRFEMTLDFDPAEHRAAGKSAAHTDIVKGRFLQLIENQRMDLTFGFETGDPAFAGEMTMSFRLKEVERGTEVTIVAENVPRAIDRQDHEAGMNSSLDNLARLVARPD